MDLQALAVYCQENNLPAYRYRQVLKNYYSGRVLTFDQMTDLPAALRADLDKKIPLLSVKPLKVQQIGHTQKTLLELKDHAKIESVLMDYDGWLTACVSSQVGCPLACAFCATGGIGYQRNLTSEEIIDQIIYWNNQLYPRFIGRVVFMGMGEPLLNWQNVLSALHQINDKDGLALGARKISLSTAGIVPQIKEFAALDTEINLALSLHAADQSTRERLMPIAKTYPLDDLISACRYYVEHTRRQLFLEYTLIQGVNDSPRHLNNLMKLLDQSRLFYLNLIPLNGAINGLEASPKAVFDTWVKTLTQRHYNFSVRRSFGAEINAACGQLAAQ
ncbi:23S rRNA (adenine(2503)-C(2))-methyltransferase RlmN [Patescibacteria group bacterium]|nr:23S rRNA (adenine(2503)-C(2))-methyltransferase RlmN [Patescibacteria group bacterium]